VLRHDPPLLHGKNSRANARWAAGGDDASYDSSLYKDGIDQDSQSPYEDERSDELGVLTFTTEPLERDLEIVGPLTLTFWARTRFTRPLTQAIIDQTIETLKGMLNLDDAMLFDQRNKRDVQWIVELNDVLDDGRAKNITSGWLSAWHRPYDPLNPTETDPGYKPFNPFYYADTFNAETHPDFNPIQEDTVYRYVVELWPTCNVFKQGHRIRLSISNSDYPHLLPILIPSENTIVLDKDHQARLDFTTTTASDEGTVWKWISGAKAKGGILGEFAAANAYLLPGKAPVEDPVTPEDEPTSDPVQNDTSSSSFCFIASALL
jgi:predicted acyl esterase